MLRGLHLMIDADLAVAVRRDDQAAQRADQAQRGSRIADRVPGDFMFKLTCEATAEVVANCDHLAKLRFSKVLPYAFTEQGAIEAANMLASPHAVEMWIFVVRVFVRMPALASVHAASPIGSPSWSKRPKPGADAQHYSPKHPQPAQATHLGRQPAHGAARPTPGVIGFINAENNIRKT